MKSGEDEEEMRDEEEEDKGQGVGEEKSPQSAPSSLRLKGTMSEGSIDGIRRKLRVKEEDAYTVVNGLGPLPIPPQPSSTKDKEVEATTTGDYIPQSGLKITPNGDNTTTTTTNTVVLVKVYVNSKALSFKSKPRHFLDRDQVVRMVIVPASKGPRASVVEEEEEGQAPTE